MRSSQRINTAPSSIDDPIAGGLKQLWPYAAGGCVGMEVEFTDGLAVDLTPLPTSMTEWFPPTSKAGKFRKDAMGPTLRQTYHGAFWVGWPRYRRDLLPDALRVRLTLRDVNGRLEGQTFEFILPIRD